MPKRKFNKTTQNYKQHTSNNNIGDNVNKSSFVVQDFKSNPSCPHGPKVCFEKGGKKFFSCSAFRSPKECQHNSEKILNKGHIKKANSKLCMSDYQINYDNHGSFSKGAKRSRKHGSPIRFFTNVPLSQILLPVTDYKFCSQCDKFVSNSNQHCSKCDDCTSKDGQTYKHCTKCSKCVKPTWTHCTQCNKCALSAGHVC
ncbi:unnamed protein product [Allacma fusca]|uniref:Uncharacterized protein n=1 Tax=Allacma fusca TaxID=39272 RepID=A0A8J2PWW1_9HEXA|nr:unnamed protein product [Allacma fusca]